MNFLTEKMKELAEKRREEFRRMEREMQELRERLEGERIESEMEEPQGAGEVNIFEKLNK